MNTANLQLEGLLMAVAALNRLLVSRGVVTSEEVDIALHRAEAGLGMEDRLDALSPANRDAIAFPVRVLRLANQSRAADPMPDFADLARRVGETKQSYNDQL